ncbi:MAG: efflux RND transporter periplasmic adaptor subunit [Candidatus Omnitrophica bacterium]|nr:efflux RND transporter periplasmic adaptor subunit [Candidatus Omnitrophota bacterium]
MRKHRLHRFRILITQIIFLATLYSLLATSLTGCSPRIPQEEVIKMPVRAIEVKRGVLKEILFYVGDIKAEDEVVVYPKVSGKIIEKLAKEGDLVKEGDVLAYVDRDEVGFKFQKAPVESPIDGVLGRVYVDRGTSVSASIPIALIVNMDKVKVRIDAVERDLPKIKVGQRAEVRVDAYPEEIFVGSVEKVSPIVNLASRTAPIEIEIANLQHRLNPGSFAKVKILVKEREGVLIIPRDALIKEDSSNYVFVVKNNKAHKAHKVHKQKIELGLCENNKFEVINGLKEGELIITMGNARLKEGDMIEVVR